jgi:hypothetical protein
MRLSELSKQIVLQLSAIASEAGLEDLVVTEDDLAKKLNPITIGGVSSEPDGWKRKKDDEDSGSRPVSGNKVVANPTSVLNFQTPQEAARDMEFIRARRDELNAKAAAAEREKEGKEKEVEDPAQQAESLVEPVLSVGQLDTNVTRTGLLSDLGESNRTGSTFISPAIRTDFIASPPIAIQEADYVPSQRHPFRLSTFEPFIPFPYVMTSTVPRTDEVETLTGNTGTDSMPLTNMSTNFYANGTSRTCHSCGIIHATRWKPGPDGPDTLCDVCGYHWLQQGQSWGLLPQYKVTFAVGGAS